MRGGRARDGNQVGRGTLNSLVSASPAPLRAKAWKILQAGQRADISLAFLGMLLTVAASGGLNETLNGPPVG